MMFLHFCEGGELHFLQIGGVSEDADDGDMFIDAPICKGAELLHEGAKSSSHPCSPGNAGKTPHTLTTWFHSRLIPTLERLSCVLQQL